jgi:hypothetical protein
MWLDPVMRDVEAYFASEQYHVEGAVTLRLGAGTMELVRIETEHSRMRGKARYGETGSGWDGRDAEGFAKILSRGGAPMSAAFEMRLRPNKVGSVCSPFHLGPYVNVLQEPIAEEGAAIACRVLTARKEYGHLELHQRPPGAPGSR